MHMDTQTSLLFATRDKEQAMRVATRDEEQATSRVKTALNTPGFGSHHLPKALFTPVLFQTSSFLRNFRFCLATRSSFPSSLDGKGLGQSLSDHCLRFFPILEGVT